MTNKDLLTKIQNKGKQLSDKSASSFRDLKTWIFIVKSVKNTPTVHIKN